MNVKEKTVLIVDDDQDLVEINSRILGRRYTVLSASSATECLVIMQTVRPDLIVMDVIMPKMGGFEAVKEIKKIQEDEKIPEEKRTKIVMLTSKDGPEFMMKAHFEVGVTTYITKPFEDKTLIEALSNLGLIKI